MQIQQLWALAVLVASPTIDKCLINPNSKEHIFHLVGRDLIPLVKKENDLQLAKTGAHAFSQDVPVFHFQRSPNAPEGVYDMILAENDPAKSQFVGRANDGSLILTPRSTGPTAQEVNGRTVATSVFTVDCKGRIGTSFEGESSSLTARSSDSTDHALQAYNYDTDGLLEKIEATSRLYAKRDEATRCPAGQIASLKPNAPANVPNGCGDAKFGALVPELVFTSCCDQHDTCFADCDQPTLSSCDDPFGQCMYDACEQKYGHGVKQVLLPGCKETAKLYLRVVQGKIGVENFNKNTQDYCVCNSSKHKSKPKSKKGPSP